MKTIPLSKGYVALVDDADYEAVSQFKWHAHPRGRGFCAARNVLKPDGKRAVQLMHRFLMPGVAQVDHRDGNSLNNQRETNLRPATHQQNSLGVRRKKIGASSRYRGVYWCRRDKRWGACLRLNGKNIYLGWFKDEADAARAYDAAAIRLGGDFASPNFKAA